MLGETNQIVKLFDGVDLEIFDPLDEHPNHQEYVFIVLKKENQPIQQTIYKRIYFKGNTPFSKMRICRTVIFKNGRVKFYDHTGIQHETHTMDDIICWRLKP